MTERIAVFPGSFDPFTNGHLNTVKRACRLFDQVVVAVMTNTKKAPLFSSTEKVALIKTAVAGLPNVRVVAQPATLTVDYVHRIGAQYLVRGLRNTADFNYEADIAAMNADLRGEIETVFLLADSRFRFVSSSMIKEVAMFGGDVAAFVPANINQALRKKYGVAND